MGYPASDSRSHLVLGGGGFLGRHIARALAMSGARVTALNRSFQAGAVAEGVEAIEADLFHYSEQEIADLVGSFDVVHHFAWSSVPALAEAAPRDDLNANVGLMICLLKGLRASGGRMVFCSSGGTVYGRTKTLSIEEDAPCRPVGAYGAGKLAAEIYAGAFRQTYGVDVRVARLSNPYGAGQSRTRMQGAITRFADEALAGNEIEIWGDGSVVRDYLHIADATTALLRLAAVDRAALDQVATLNIGSGVGVDLRLIVSTLADVLGRPVPVRFVEGRPFDVPRNVLDVKRAMEQLAWQATLSLRDGIERLVRDLEGDPQTLFSGSAA